MTTTLEAQLILPKNGNDGSDLSEIHAGLFVDLCVKYGGCTVAYGLGGWVDPDGNIQQEPVNIYNVAYDPEAAPIEELERIACDYGARAGQKAVYMRHGTGHVQFLEPLTEQEKIWSDPANTIPA